MFTNKSFILLIFIFFLKPSFVKAQKQMVRIAKLTIDSTHLLNFNVALNEQMNAAIKKEAGVLTYYAVADKKNPTMITILEIYADSSAYKIHIETEHFKKYKSTVQKMVTSLELIDVNLIGAANKNTN